MVLRTNLKKVSGAGRWCPAFFLISQGSNNIMICYVIQLLPICDKKNTYIKSYKG